MTHSSTAPISIEILDIGAAAHAKKNTNHAHVTVNRTTHMLNVAGIEGDSII
jgi:hypothetical protein